MAVLLLCCVQQLQGGARQCVCVPHIRKMQLAGAAGLHVAEADFHAGRHSIISQHQAHTIRPQLDIAQEYAVMQWITDVLAT